MKLIEFRDIYKKFGANIIYNGLDIFVKQGETLTIFGGSGTGKSVMLRMLIGLLHPDSGSILFDNKDITKYNENQFINIRKRIAMLFQNGALFDSLTVAENIAYPLRMHGIKDEKEIKKTVLTNLERVGLPGIEKRMPSELSGGMQKRVGLARALATNPEVLLYDEPTTGLDPINVSLINNLIKNLQKDLNITSIVVTHDMESAFTVSDRIAMLWDKKIIFEGTVKDIKATNNPIVYNFIHGLPMQ
ncbi:ABC transporter ATP-binding protein [bacterium]|nr:ABC transporter ATP-binding protein [bacterium]